MIEQRTEPRYVLDDQVSLAAPQIPARRAQIMDVSYHGLRIRLDADLVPGTPVKVRLDFLSPDQPASAPILKGQVMHRFPEPGGGSWQTGIRLLFADEAQEQSFQTALAAVVTR